MPKFSVGDRFQVVKDNVAKDGYSITSFIGKQGTITYIFHSVNAYLGVLDEDKDKPLAEVELFFDAEALSHVR